MTYAENTTVTVARSRSELLELLEKHDAESVGFQSSPVDASVTFHARDRWVRFRLVFATETTFAKTSGGQLRSPAARQQAREQHVRSRWRALVLVVKAKLESVEAGIEEFEAAFLAQVVLPDGSTVEEHVAPTLAAVYREDRVRPLLQLGAP